MICEPDNILNHVCYEVGVRELIVQGYLCPLVTRRRGRDRPSSLHVRAGEFISGEVEDLMDTDNLVEAACREIIEKTRDRKSALIFASGVRHGEHIAATMRSRYGVEVGTVFGDTLSFIRDRMISDFKAGRLKYLVNVNVLTMGFDAPNIDCAAMVRPTLSPGSLLILARIQIARREEGLSCADWRQRPQARPCGRHTRKVRYLSATETLP